MLRPVTWIALVAALAIAPQSVGRLGRVLGLRNAGGGSLSLLTMSDLTWVGEARVANSGTLGTDIRGSETVDATGMAVRYVSSAGSCKDTRRFITTTYSIYGRSITAISAAASAVITTSSAHNLATGNTINIQASNSTPSANGAWAVTVIDSTHFSIPLTVSVAGTTGWEGVSPNTWGDFVEYCLPAAASWYTGTDPTLAPALIETGRWPGAEVTSGMGIAGDLAQGNQIGGLYWDAATGLLRINIYGYYFGLNMPSHLEVQLLDTAHASLAGYRAVGSHYGPWYYRGTTSTDTWWKATNGGYAIIPASAQSDLGGRDTLMCGMMGALYGLGHSGLGLTAANWPSTGLAANSVMFSTDHSGRGLRVADYSDECNGGCPSGAYIANPQSPYVNLRRDSNYTMIPSFGDHIFPGGGLWNPNSGTNPTLPGFWAMSMDQTSGCAWVETTNVQGIVSFGRQVSGYVGYGFSSISNTFKVISAISESGTTVTVNMPLHKLQTGDTVNIGCVAPSGFTGAGFVVSVTDSDHFTYTAGASGLGTGSFTTAGDATVTDGGIVHCSNSGAMIGFGWHSGDPDITDPAVGPHNYQNSYEGSSYDGVVRVLDPVKVRAVGSSAASPYNDNINWAVIGSWYRSAPAAWHIPPYYTKPASAGSANDSRIDQSSTSGNGLVWDNCTSSVSANCPASAANQLVWMHIASASSTWTTSSIPATIQVFSVR